jgi:hypothetical protein
MRRGATIGQLRFVGPDDQLQVIDFRQRTSDHRGIELVRVTCKLPAFTAESTILGLGILALPLMWPA